MEKNNLKLPLPLPSKLCIEFGGTLGVSLPITGVFFELDRDSQFGAVKIPFCPKLTFPIIVKAGDCVHFEIPKDLELEVLL